jgi:hypothetical protein
MPSYVVKAAPDSDLYCIWSTVVDCPTWLFESRADALMHHEINADRMDRADRTGTSSIDGFYGWQDERFHIREVTPDADHLWYLPRTKLVDFIRSGLETDDDSARWHLLESEPYEVAEAVQ